VISSGTCELSFSAVPGHTQRRPPALERADVLHRMEDRNFEPEQAVTGAGREWAWVVCIVPALTGKRG